jgi:hypothetical protein
MNIDERIEALTMNMELVHRDIRDQRESIRQLQEAALKDGENIRQPAAVHKDGENIHELALVAQSTLDSIRSLENTASAHEQRLDNLEHS